MRLRAGVAGGSGLHVPDGLPSAHAAHGHLAAGRTARDTAARDTVVTKTTTVTARSTPSAGVSRAPARWHRGAAPLQVSSRQNFPPEPRRKSVVSEVDIRHSQGYRFSCTQEVEVGTADTNCRACRSSRTRPEGAASSTRVIQQYNRVAEVRSRTPSGSPGRGESPPGYRKAPDWKVVPGHASAIPAAQPSQAGLRKKKADAVGR